MLHATRNRACGFNAEATCCIELLALDLAGFQNLKRERLQLRFPLQREPKALHPARRHEEMPLAQASTGRGDRIP